MHIEFLLEEQSASAFLEGILPKLLPDSVTWSPITFRGKSDLLNNLESRLKAYRRWITDEYRVVVLVDEDRQDCLGLKHRLEQSAARAGLSTKSSSGGNRFAVLNRIAVEELESWFFGDSQALTTAFPQLKENFLKKAAYRNPDAIKGGTWKTLWHLLKGAGYYPAGLPKIEVASLVSRQMDPQRNHSGSFCVFRDGIAELLQK